MLQRIVAVILALPLTATALAMLFILQRWYETFPGVIETGTYNAHFIRDVGCAVLVQAGVLFVYAFA